MNSIDFSPLAKANKKSIHSFLGADADVNERQNLYEINFKENISQAYLSHIVCVVEQYVREQLNKPFFAIKLRPSNLKEIGLVCKSQYSLNRYFQIFYPTGADEKQVRLGIAHELGHLVYLIWTQTENYLSNDPKAEQFASLFAIIAVADRCDFYQKRAKNFVHKSFDEIVRTMSLLHNTKNGKHNLSHNPRK